MGLLMLGCGSGSSLPPPTAEPGLSLPASPSQCLLLGEGYLKRPLKPLEGSEVHPMMGTPFLALPSGLERWLYIS